MSTPAETKATIAGPLKARTLGQRRVLATTSGILVVLNRRARSSKSPQVRGAFISYPGSCCRSSVIRAHGGHVAALSEFAEVRTIAVQ